MQNDLKVSITFETFESFSLDSRIDLINNIFASVHEKKLNSKPNKQRFNKDIRRLTTSSSSSK